MSYILDALNKSESERRAGAIPAISAGASFVVAPLQPARRRSAAILLGVGMLVTGLALGNWRPWKTITVTPFAVDEVTTLPKEVKTIPEPLPLLPAKQQAAAATANKLGPLAKPPGPAKTTSDGSKPRLPLAKAPPAKAGHIYSFSELPPKIRNSLPKISFGGFAGVAESEARIGYINNRLIKEGEEVSQGLKLEKVDSDGVVLSYEGHRFRP